jgi:hypothetical protein
VEVHACVLQTRIGVNGNASPALMALLGQNAPLLSAAVVLSVHELNELDVEGGDGGGKGGSSQMQDVRGKVTCQAPQR